MQDQNTLPRTAETAAQLYSKGKPITIVALESEGASQKDLHDLAFSMIARALRDRALGNIEALRDDCEDLLAKAKKDGFSERELASAESFAFVVLQEGYAKTVLKFPETQRIVLNG
jgi:hypothetical protein